MNKTSCPICKKQQDFNERYLNYICNECAQNVTDINGEKLEFYNQDFGCGYEARFSSSKKVYNSHICYVNGIECYADEARFGGIVIQIKK